MSTDMEFDELSTLENNKQVFAPSGPFEKNKAIVPGDFYAAAEEVIPEVAAESSDVAGDMEDPTGKEFPLDRRDFMKLFSAGAVASAATGCINRPVEKAIPYVNQPKDQVPGTPTYYASTCNQCSAGCGMVVKTREGRPTKLEGNPGHPVSQGALCALGQASIQGLYHPERKKAPEVKFGKKHVAVEWEEAYGHLAKKFGDGTKIGILTCGSTGSRHKFFRDFLRTMGSPERNLYTWEPNGLFHSITEAHKLAFGVNAMPRFDLRNADNIVGIGSDFLDVGVSPIYQAKSFSQAHAYRNGKMGKLTQFEATLSLKGEGADVRYPIPVDGELLTSLLLLRALHENNASKGTAEEKSRVKEILDQYSEQISNATNEVGVKREVFDKLADSLLKERSLVLAGGSTNFNEDSTSLQLVAILINILIGAYGKALVLDRGHMPTPIVPGDLRRFLNEAEDLDVLCHRYKPYF
ncbi:MAG: hypothetical protein R3B45_05650 [Bdellovibrionota bacterium]